ncbi:hypothetical protein BA062_27435 [Prauserella flavalba]|uniref:DUF6292 domain-containing protein n=2 Tax=Prauserella flavalba TaxID=1477506 RepID=A0A318LSD3_9PSEU|nr:hypothetical protein BA062_27435 [Prauserella flavalba]
MLGLSGTDGARTRRASDTQSVADGVSAFADELSGYLSAVAGALGVPADGVIFEVSDTATAYVALTRRSARWPGQDLMLLWSELRGWSLSVETRPAEPSVVLAGLGGDLVPAPRVVAAFVGDVLAGRRAEPVRPVVPMPRNRAELAARMREYVAS